MTSTSKANPLVTLRQTRQDLSRAPRRRGPGQALLPVDIDVAHGEFLTIVGPSGCGKSTLLSLIAGLQPATSGEVRIGDTVVTDPYTDLGIVFQKDLLLPWRTALDNVLIQAEVRGIGRKTLLGRAMELLELVGLQGFENSIRMSCRVACARASAICRALLHDPPLLLMDEPFAALDAITRDQLALDFQTFWQRDRRTVVFITHNIAEAVFLGDRVMVMTARPGRIAEIIDIDLPRPRELVVRDAPEFTRYTGRVRELFMQHGILRARS